MLFFMSEVPLYTERSLNALFATFGVLPCYLLAQRMPTPLCRCRCTWNNFLAKKNGRHTFRGQENDAPCSDKERVVPPALAVRPNQLICKAKIFDTWYYYSRIDGHGFQLRAESCLRTPHAFPHSLPRSIIHMTLR